MRLPTLFLSSLLVVGGSLSAQVAQPGLPTSPSLIEQPVIIFFAWDQPVIDGDAGARLEAVVASARDPGLRLELAGHADRSGPSASNIRSGRKRAEAVFEFLAARGVPGAAMTIVSHGESRPLIPTADGVREPQNRRVEIVVTRAPGG